MFRIRLNCLCVHLVHALSSQRPPLHSWGLGLDAHIPGGVIPSLSLSVPLQLQYHLLMCPFISNLELRCVESGFVVCVVTWTLLWRRRGTVAFKRGKLHLEKHVCRLVLPV
ncbi:hypothetical protein V8E51_019582 [Hyaloscypha variabilis]